MDFKTNLTPKENMTTVFNWAINVSGVKEYLGDEEDYPYDVYMFHKIVYSRFKPQFSTYKDEEACFDKIIKFTNILMDYHGLKGFSYDDNAVVSTTRNALRKAFIANSQQLRLLYHEITGDTLEGAGK